MNINALVAESLLARIGKGAGIAAGVGALGVGADVIRRKMAGETNADIANKYIGKAGEVKDKISGIFKKPSSTDHENRRLTEKTGPTVNISKAADENEARKLAGKTGNVLSQAQKDENKFNLAKQQSVLNKEKADAVISKEKTDRMNRDSEIEKLKGKKLADMRGQAMVNIQKHGSDNKPETTNPSLHAAKETLKTNAFGKDPVRTNRPWEILKNIWSPGDDKPSNKTKAVSDALRKTLPKPDEDTRVGPTISNARRDFMARNSGKTI